MPSPEDAPSPDQPWNSICPRCRYDTRGLQSDRCPECGIDRAEARELHATATKQRRTHALLLTTVSALLLGLIAWLLIRWSYSRLSPDAAFIIRTALVIAACATVLSFGAVNDVRVMRGREPFRLWVMVLLVAVLLALLPP